MYARVRFTNVFYEQDDCRNIVFLKVKEISFKILTKGLERYYFTFSFAVNLSDSFLGSYKVRGSICLFIKSTRLYIKYEISFKKINATKCMKT